MSYVFDFSVIRIRETINEQFKKIRVEYKGKQNFLNNELATYITDKVGVKQTPEGYLSFPAAVIDMAHMKGIGGLINVVPHNPGVLLQFIMEDEIAYLNKNTQKYSIIIGSGIHNIFEYEYITQDKKVTSYIFDYGTLEESSFVYSFHLNMSHRTIADIYYTCKEVVNNL